MMESKSQVVTKLTTVKFSEEDLTEIVRAYQEHVETGELFEVKLLDSKSNDVIIVIE